MVHSNDEVEAIDVTLIQRNCAGLDIDDYSDVWMRGDVNVDGELNAIDATFGRRTKAVIVTDSDHIILSAIQPRHIASRLENRGDGAVAGDAPYESEEKDENE